MIQSMTYTLLDATEKAAQPPMLGQADMIKSDLELWSGGVTWVDAEYDERLGEALRPIPLDLRGLPMGVTAAERAQAMIAEAFYLNKLSLPPVDREMTAFETAQRIQEYIRQALPLFEPMESEYNGQLCDMTFSTLQQNFAFSANEVPQELDGADVEFKFVSPLQENEERKSAGIYMETKALLREAAEIDPVNINMVDSRQSLRDALLAAGAPAVWLRSDEQMDEIAAQQQAKAEEAKTMDDLERGGQVAEQIGKAATAMNEGGVTDAAG
jgi:hypothetical protein